MRILEHYGSTAKLGTFANSVESIAEDPSRVREESLSTLSEPLRAQLVVFHPTPAPTASAARPWIEDKRGLHEHSLIVTILIHLNP